MSYYEDFIADNLPYDDDLRYMYIEEDAKRGYWTTRDGSMIHVSQMTDSHILNTIRYIERNDMDDMYLPWIVRFKKELRERGVEV